MLNIAPYAGCQRNDGVLKSVHEDDAGKSYAGLLRMPCVCNPAPCSPSTRSWSGWSGWQIHRPCNKERAGTYSAPADRPSRRGPGNSSCLAEIPPAETHSRSSRPQTTRAASPSAHPGTAYPMKTMSAANEIELPGPLANGLYDPERDPHQVAQQKTRQRG